MIFTRWDTKFAAWVDGRGASQLVRDLELRGVRVTRVSIYNWVSGRIPRKRTIDALIDIANGAIALSDIYAHANVVNSSTPGRDPNRCKAGTQ